MTTVVAAVIEQDQGILVCQRKQGSSHSLKWEFPGGKVELGETMEAALQRELREELRIEANIGPELARYEYAYPNKNSILLIFFQVSSFTGEPINLVFETMEWSPRKQLPAYDFLEGDIDFVKTLTESVQP